MEEEYLHRKKINAGAGTTQTALSCVDIKSPAPTTQIQEEYDGTSWSNGGTLNTSEEIFRRWHKFKLM